MHQFGVPVLSISDVVSNLNIEQGNMFQRHFIKNLTHAKWVWKELYLRSLWAMRQVVLPVDQNNCIKLPVDMQGQVNVSVVDHHGNQQLIGQNPNMNTVEILCPTTACTCACNGQGTLCGAFDKLTMTTEQVIIKGVSYTKTTWIKNVGGGNVVEFSKVPIFISSGPSDQGAVQYVIEQKQVCQFAITETGCITATDENRERFRRFCGCYISLPFNDIWGHCRERLDVPPIKSHYGEWNWNAAAGDLIELKHVKAKQVIVGVQTSGEVDGQEIVIPEYSLNAMLIGILWRQTMFNPNAKAQEKRAAGVEYNKAKMDLNKFLRPMSMRVIANLQVEIPLW